MVSVASSGQNAASPSPLGAVWGRPAKVSCFRHEDVAGILTAIRRIDRRRRHRGESIRDAVRVRPLFFRRERCTLSTNAPKDQSVSSTQVKDDLPSAVSSGYWVGSGVFRRDTRQHLAYRGPMPGLAPKGSADLICDDFHIHGHRLSWPQGRPNDSKKPRAEATYSHRQRGASAPFGG
jgi:hypothetical protein